MQADEQRERKQIDREREKKQIDKREKIDRYIEKNVLRKSER